MKISRAWLQRYFEKELPPVDMIAEALTFHAFEIEEVVGEILDVKVLPDRAGYGLSHRGIAKEISAILSIPLKRDPLREALPQWDVSKKLSIKVDEKYVLRHTGAFFQGVTVGPSPAWLVEYLESLGQRSINNIVDASNFVMLDMGQPSHAFDADAITNRDGHIEIHIRGANVGEKVEILTGEVCTMKENMYVIADGLSGEALDVAGVKGGQKTGVSVSTKNLFISAGNYDGELIRKMAQNLGLMTDASQRFQNRPSPELTAYGMRALLTLIQEIAGGELEGIVDIYNKKQEARQVAITVPKIERVLGATYSEKEVEDVFTRLDLPYEKETDGTFMVTPPFERSDIGIPEDLVEEVGRIIGYDRVLPVEISPYATGSTSGLPDAVKAIEGIKDALSKLGFSEVSTYTMLSEGDEELAKPLADDKKFLRTDLAKGHAIATRHNANYLPLFNLPDVRLFEIGRVWPEGKEKALLGVTYWSGEKKMSEKRAQLFAEVSQTLSTLLGKEVKGKVAENTLEFELDELLRDASIPNVSYELSNEGMYHSFSIYPFALRDVAVWTPQGTTADSVQDTIKNAAGDLLYRLDIFDTFEKEGRISYAYRLVLQAKDHTLSEKEINSVMESVTQALVSRKGFEVR